MIFTINIQTLLYIYALLGRAINNSYITVSTVISDYI